MHNIDNPSWSIDSKYIYFNGTIQPYHHEFFRVRVKDGTLDHLVDLANFPEAEEGWFGVTPDGTLLAAREAVSQEIYRLNCELP